jgi:hypothetical protein
MVHVFQQRSPRLWRVTMNSTTLLDIANCRGRKIQDMYEIIVVVSNLVISGVHISLHN